MKTSAGYLIPRTSAEDLSTSLQIQSQNLGWISRSLAKSLNPQPRVSNVQPDIWNSNIRQDVESAIIIYLSTCISIFLFTFLSIYTDLVVRNVLTCDHCTPYLGAFIDMACDCQIQLQAWGHLRSCMRWRTVNFQIRNQNEWRWKKIIKVKRY